MRLTLIQGSKPKPFSWSVITLAIGLAFVQVAKAEVSLPSAAIVMTCTSQSSDQKLELTLDDANGKLKAAKLNNEELVGDLHTTGFLRSLLSHYYSKKGFFSLKVSRLDESQAKFTTTGSIKGKDDLFHCEQAEKWQVAK